MNPSELKKDKNKSIRINSEILKVLEAQGMTVQMFIDECLDKRIDLELNISVKEKL